MFAVQQLQRVDLIVVTMSSDAWWLSSLAAVRAVDGTDVVDVRPCVDTLVTDDAEVEGSACRTRRY